MRGALVPVPPIYGAGDHRGRLPTGDYSTVTCCSRASVFRIASTHWAGLPAGPGRLAVTRAEVPQRTRTV
jgi:hypothetical protein